MKKLFALMIAMIMVLSLVLVVGCEQKKEAPKAPEAPKAEAPKAPEAPAAGAPAAPAAPAAGAPAEAPKADPHKK
ncbi:MAG: hypothetical protein C0402_06020 [Thermodesulfovibrio sp.]|nr:hypothetical protein [Thermodesulfovibrio sp.]